MPQMFPMNWTLMMLTFSIMLILTSISIYFSFNLNPTAQTLIYKTPTNIWLW
uniref:ATP synthase F0 subunit 8 n=1 Tax=Prionopetalum kraepelini TaxID=2931675 RepID=A0A8T9JB24_9MYRI|nr:ATP synthase F0 subunit 8 [Prionopetalum kraepelini]UOF70468.1 ATP synthase F0 subunit 8 [Prionopetalum kraepelini]